MERILKIDWDYPYWFAKLGYIRPVQRAMQDWWIMNRFTRTTMRVFRVYRSKRTYLPDIFIQRAERTRKGVHLYIQFKDNEINTSDEDYLILQSVYESDFGRTLFDYLRLKRREKVWNLLFKSKNKYVNKLDVPLTKSLNTIVKKYKERYLTMKDVLYNENIDK